MTENTPVRRVVARLLDDPRSPTIGIPRTPIQAYSYESEEPKSRPITRNTRKSRNFSVAVDETEVKLEHSPVVKRDSTSRLRQPLGCRSNVNSPAQIVKMKQISAISRNLETELSGENTPPQRSKRRNQSPSKVPLLKNKNASPLSVKNI